MNRERLKILRDHLAGLPDERVDMRHYFARGDCSIGDDFTRPDLDKDCGTAACIAGWASYLFDDEPEYADRMLGLKGQQEDALCYPTGYRLKGRYTRADAIAAIDSMLASPDDDALPVWPERAA